MRGIKTISLDVELIRYIEEHKINLSRFVSDCIKAHQNTHDKRDLSIEDIDDEIKNNKDLSLNQIDRLKEIKDKLIQQEKQDEVNKKRLELESKEKNIKGFMKWIKDNYEVYEDDKRVRKIAEGYYQARCEKNIPLDEYCKLYELPSRQQAMTTKDNTSEDGLSDS